MSMSGKTPYRKMSVHPNEYRKQIIIFKVFIMKVDKAILTCMWAKESPGCSEEENQVESLPQRGIETCYKAVLIEIEQGFFFFLMHFTFCSSAEQPLKSFMRV